MDAGDSIQGGLIGSMSHGSYIIDIMNEVGYDVAAIGNHEFDYTIPMLMKRAEELDCGYISCNFKNLETNELVFDPYRIVDMDGTKVAFVGVSTPETIRYSTPVYFQNDKGEYIYTFCEYGNDLYDTVQENVDKVKAEGADYVILLSHLGESNVEESWSSVKVAANTTDVDAILDGHSHEVTDQLTVKNKNGEDVLISQTGTKLKNIGKLTITKDGKIKTELVDKVPEPDSSMEFPDDSWKEAENRTAVKRLFKAGRMALTFIRLSKVDFDTRRKCFSLSISSSS